MLSGSIGQDFLGKLFLLNSRSVWLDAGSGEGAAIDSYFARNRAPRVESTETLLEAIADKPVESKATAVGITFRMEPSSISGRGQYKSVLSPNTRRKLSLTGQRRFIIDRYFEEISDEEIGKVDLITDIFGIFSYTADPGFVLKRYLDRLNVGGTLYIFTDSVYVRKNSSTKGGIGFAHWLSFQKWHGFEIKALGESFSIRKTSEKFLIPEFDVVEASDNRTPITKYLTAH